MRQSQPLIFCFFLLAIFLSADEARADAVIYDDVLELEPQEAESVLRIELEQLRSKISLLESSFTDKLQELRRKDDAIEHMNQIIQEKSERILVLQREVEVEKKGAVDAAELLEKAHARATGLEKQIEKLKSDVQLQSQKKDALEARAGAAEKKTEELKLKLETLQKINEEQKHKMRKTSQDLKVAEEALLRMREEVSSKKKELKMIYQAWLPPWLANHLGHYQEYASIKWKTHGKPAFDTGARKASEVATRVQTHIEPHLNIVKTKLLPVLEERWTSFALFVKPHAQSASSKAVEIYESSLATIKPHARRVQEVAHPYILQAKTFSKPYVDQVAIVARPHVEKAHIILKPYTKKIVHQYAKFLKSATAYHLQVQAFIKENLRKHELTRALATKELVWFLASTCLAFPVYFAYEAFVYAFCKKTRKSTRSSRLTTNSRQRNKRRHADK